LDFLLKMTAKKLKDAGQGFENEFHETFSSGQIVKKGIEDVNLKVAGARISEPRGLYG
jgi:hypothetical protein